MIFLTFKVLCRQVVLVVVGCVMKVVNQSANSTVKVGLVTDRRNANLEH